MIGGKDDTMNVYLNDGRRDIKCVVSVELARRLGPYLRGPRIRFFGQGIWYRFDENWELKSFTASDFTPLEEKPLNATLESLRGTLAGIDVDDFLATMQELREG